MANDDLNLDALFIGDKAENGDLYKDLLDHMVTEHLEWRKNYMVQDAPLISHDDQVSESFKATEQKMKSVLQELSDRLQASSIPWHSPRYWGQMNSETLMPSLLAYSYAMLWNGNNVAYESSPATSQMEEEVGHDFARLFSFDKGWGHIVADGSLANLEGLWYARNIKSLPLAMKEVKPELVADKTDWQLLNMSVSDIMDCLEQCDEETIDRIKEKSARAGVDLSKLGKWIVPQTKHYSWLKAADIIGIGLDQVIAVPVDDHYHMDVASLEEIIRSLTDQHIPILGVVAVVGSTEEGAIDYVDKIADLRDTLKQEGIDFYFHVDAAYGGYARSLVLDSHNDVIPYDHLKEMHYEYHVFQENKEYLSRDVYNALVNISRADSVTVDPHKMGYVPYAAGGIAIRDIRMRNVISYFATYVFEKGTEAPALLGAYILEGSKAGATAASVWAAHHVLPLNITGYGKLIGQSIEAANRFYDFLKTLDFTINGVHIIAHPLVKPDFNIVDWAFNIENNQNIDDMNRLNHTFFDETSIYTGSAYDKEFLTSHTDFAKPDYGDSPLHFVESCGFTTEEWQKAQKVTILRACILTPFMYDKDNFARYAGEIKTAMEKYLTQALQRIQTEQ